MRQTLIVILLFLTSLQMFSSPEDMYGMYDKDGKHREMTEKMEQIVVQHEQAEKERQEKMSFILGISVLMGLVPFAYIGYRAVRERQWQTNQKGTMQALGIALLGGVVLFVFNYGLLYLKIIHTNAFYRFGPVVGLIIIVGTIIMINRKT
ncbi:MAG: hypothetical protein E7073_07140 [Bacteroidales bacterium]|nr:hypothetical protein [Bacteroidales bacterium]